MTALSVNDRVRFTPASYEGREGAPVYLLGALGFRERPRFRADLQASGAPFTPDTAFAVAARKLVEQLEPDNMAELLATIDAFTDLLAQDTAQPLQPLADDASDDDKAERQAETDRRKAIITPYEQVLDALRGHQQLDRLFGQRALFQELAPPLAAAYGLRGWENVKQPFRRVNGVVPDELMDALPQADQLAIGAEVLRLMTVSAAQRGN